jgi:polysaccharide deacetylase 2 family uncharacterized protein YibQ
MRGIRYKDHFSSPTDRGQAGPDRQSTGSRWQSAFATAWVFTLALPALLFVLDAGGPLGSAVEVGAKGALGLRTAAADPMRLEVYGTDRSAPMVLDQHLDSGALTLHGTSVEVISVPPPAAKEETSAGALTSGCEAMPLAAKTEADAIAPTVTSLPETTPAPETTPTKVEALVSGLARESLAVETLRERTEEVIVTAAPPAWRQNAARAPVADGQPVIALILDDLGLNRSGTRAAIELEAPMTLAFMSYADRLTPLLKRARRRGHELMLHFPMEPVGEDIDPGPKALMVAHAPWEIRLFLEWGLARVPGIVGVNNHMGSRFTAEPEAMAIVMEVLREKGLFYLDSRTTASDVGATSAAETGVPFLSRDVFLDHGEQDHQAVLAQLARLERIAHSQGHAIGIGHPHETTLSAIEAWRQGLAARGVILVPVTEILRRRIEARDAGVLAERR